MKFGNWLIMRLCTELVSLESVDSVGIDDAVALMLGGGKLWSMKELCRQLLTISSPSSDPNCSTFLSGGGRLADGVDAGRWSLFNLLLMFFSCWMGDKML